MFSCTFHKPQTSIGYDILLPFIAALKQACLTPFLVVCGLQFRFDKGFRSAWQHAHTETSD